MNLEQFKTEFIEDIRNESIIKGQLPSTIFLETMSEKMQSMEYIFNPTIFSFYKVLSKNRTAKFDLYGFDEIDKSFVLLSNEYIDDINASPMNTQEVNDKANWMLNYIREAVDGNIRSYIDASSDINQLSLDLKKRFEKDFVDLENDDCIDKIKLFIVTNRKLGSKYVNKKLDDYRGRQVELNVWDIDRIFDVISSGQDKEAIFIDVPRFNNNEGLPFLMAEFGSNFDYDAYLSILPGKFLSDIYWEHGSRLLEGNVRAFLSAKGKVNKGIRNTIIRDPGKFFTYNNGIACTAKDIKFSSDGSKIIGIEDLQIINGGQTTASLTSAIKKDKASLDMVFVPMKLTIIKSDEYDDMVQNISRFANSQNKVTDADLFSNHPFHRDFEKLSRKIIAPAKVGENHGTYWYYERSRGKYQQSIFNLTKKSEIDTYYKKNPKNQVILKEELAKYIMAAEYLRPDLVSKGRAKNMNEFALKIDYLYKTDKTVFNDRYYKNAIVYTILFRTVDIIVSKASWYNAGGIKLNIVPYTISKIISSIPKGYCIDFNRIWREQQLYPSFNEEVNKVAKWVNEYLNDSKGIIVTEYAKKEETWNHLRKLEYTLSDKFLKDLISKDIIENELQSNKKEIKQNEAISDEIKVAELAKTENGDYWQRLLREGLRRSLLTKSEEDMIKNYIIELSKPIPKRFPEAIHYKIAMKIRKRLEENGVLV